MSVRIGIEVPPEYREAAEAVRRHLVAHRGGALFLSSSDALRLIGWLDRGVPVCDILRAIERAAEARRKRRSRVPLGLGHAGRHLGKPTRGALAREAVRPVASGEGGRLGPLVRWIRERARGDARREALHALADELAGLPEGVQLAEAAMIRIRAFHDAAFDGLGEAGRAALRARARQELGDLVHMLDERELVPLIEEGARALAREGYEWLSAATVWDLLRPEECP